jgi:hypothetical protein
MGAESAETFARAEATLYISALELGSFSPLLLWMVFSQLIAF